MANEKNLGLAFALQDAPPALQKAATDTKDAFLAYAKAKKQIKLWSDQLKVDKDAYIKAQKDFDKELKKWDPFLINDIVIEEKV